MNKTIIGIIAAAVIVVAGWYGYNSMSKAPSAGAGTAPASNTSGGAAPAAAGALPDAIMTQVKTAIDAQLGAIPGITAEQKTKVSECVTAGLAALVKPEDVAKLATDTAVMQKMMTDLAASTKGCLTKAGVAG